MLQFAFMSSMWVMLDRCEMCEKAEAKYRCPGCLIRTCSLSCVQKHKSERHCNGERIKTAYVSIKEFTDANLLSGESDNMSH